MPTIILAKEGVVLQKIALLKERTRIGRRTYNDVVIDEPNISADHAVIVTTAGGPCYEDMGSTNGSYISGLRVTKHVLQNGDVVALGKYTIQYRADTNAIPATNSAVAVVATERPDDSLQAAMQSDSQTDHQIKSAAIQILDGPHAGKKIELTQTLTTIGQPDRHVAALTRTELGYNLTHIRGENFPAVNGKPADINCQMLVNGDLIDLAGTKILFIN